MKEIKSWKKVVLPILYFCVLYIFCFGFFHCWKNFRVLWKIFIFGEKNFRDFSFYYFWKQKHSRKSAKITKSRKSLPAKVSAPKVFTFWIYYQAMQFHGQQTDGISALLKRKTKFVSQKGYCPQKYSVANLQILQFLTTAKVSELQVVALILIYQWKVSKFLNNYRGL